MSTVDHKVAYEMNCAEREGALPYTALASRYYNHTKQSRPKSWIEQSSDSAAERLESSHTVTTARRARLLAFPSTVSNSPRPVYLHHRRDVRRGEADKRSCWPLAFTAPKLI